MPAAYAVDCTDQSTHNTVGITAPMEQTTTPPTLDERFDNLLISPLRVATMLGRRSPGEVSYEESEQNFARRRLLQVEKVAIKNKRLAAQAEASFVDYISYELHELILQDMQEQISDCAALFSSTLNFNHQVPVMLDILSTRAASVSRLEPCVASMPWLYDELMHIVNSPRFRKKDARGRVIVVESLRTALSFIGIENLRILLPSLLLKRAMPQITDPFPAIKVKLTQYATGTGITARLLASQYQCQPFAAYIAGMLANLGRCCVTKAYFKTFDYMHRHKLEEAQRLGQRDVHSALLKITPSANYLIAMQHEFSDALSANLFAHMDFQRLPVTPALQALNTPSASLAGPYQPLSRLLQAARCYTQIKMLHQARAAEAAEIKPRLRAQRFLPGALELLKSADIFTLPLTVEAHIS